MSLKKFILCLLLLTSSLTFAANEALPNTETNIKIENEIIKITLNNGMKVVLKHTDFDSDEVLIRLQAKGGFASLPIDKQAPAIIAPQIIMETHFANIISSMLSDEEIDFEIEIMPYFRGMIGYSLPMYIDNLLSAINKIFVAQHLSHQAFERVLQRAKGHLIKSNFDFEEIFQNAFISLNTQHFPWLRNLHVNQLDNVDLKTCEELFNTFFSNPADFVVIIVGNFDTKTIKSKLETHLASIPKTGKELNSDQAVFPTHPSKITEKEIKGVGEKTSLARFTFFLDTPIDYETILKSKYLCSLIENKLSTLVKKVFNQDLGIEVIYQLPNFPYANSSWFVIQFRSEYKMLTQIKKLLLLELAKLCKVGISKEDIQTHRKKLEEEDEFWLRDNQFWLTLLLDYSIWNWEVQDNAGSYKEYSKVNLNEEINNLLKQVFCSKTYTFIHSKPS